MIQERGTELINYVNSLPRMNVERTNINSTKEVQYTFYTKDVTAWIQSKKKHQYKWGVIQIRKSHIGIQLDFPNKPTMVFEPKDLSDRLNLPIISRTDKISGIRVWGDDRKFGTVRIRLNPEKLKHFSLTSGVFEEFLLELINVSCR